MEYEFHWLSSIADENKILAETSICNGQVNGHPLLFCHGGALL